jgi:hypothetical protein
VKQSYFARRLDVSRQVVSGLLNSDDHREALRTARKEAASGLAEESLKIADGATPESVHVAKLQTDVRRWMASKWDSQVYGEQRRAPEPLSSTSQRCTLMHFGASRVSPIQRPIQHGP